MYAQNKHMPPLCAIKRTQTQYGIQVKMCAY